MSDEPSADLGLIARQQRQLLDQMNTLRDDMTVLTAIVMRLDGTVAGLVQEIRAIHSQHGRLANRVRALEDRQ
jgi:uncharacterized protein YoxC